MPLLRKWKCNFAITDDHDDSVVHPNCPFLSNFDVIHETVYPKSNRKKQTKKQTKTKTKTFVLFEIHVDVGSSNYKCTKRKTYTTFHVCFIYMFNKIYICRKFSIKTSYFVNGIISPLFWVFPSWCQGFRWIRNGATSSRWRMTFQNEGLQFPRTTSLCHLSIKVWSSNFSVF